MNTPTVVLVAVLFVGWTVFEDVRGRSRLHALGQVLEPGSAGVKGLFYSYRLVGRYQGRAVEFRYGPGGRSHRAKLDALSGCSASLWFTIDREGVGARLAKGLHLMKDLEIGDPGLDGRFTFRSSEPERFTSCFRASEDARRVVETLFAPYQVQSTHLDDSMLHVTCEGRACLPENADEARRMLELLRALAESGERA